MDYDPKDNEVVNLLKKLKETNGAYPQEMLALRRQGYLKQIAQVSGGAEAAVALKNTVKGGKGSGLPPAAGRLVEALLVAAIVAEVGVFTIIYRNKLVEYFQSFSKDPRVEEVSSPPSIPSPLPEIELTPEPVITATETQTLAPTSTPSLELTAEPTNESADGRGSNSNNGGNNNSGGGSGGSNGNGSSSVSTPDSNGNNGNHYGQTPRPDRTKEPGGNSN